MVAFAVAFVGGMLSLLSPCSALLLPSFFAYSFASPGRLIARTMIFYAGLVTLFIPLGLGVGGLGALFRDHLAAVAAISGSLLILIGAYQLVAGGFALPGSSMMARIGGGESATATYVLGMVYGVGGFCSGPILGGILTLAAASGQPVTGALLLAVFAMGMVVPLFALAMLWDRIGTRRVGVIRRAKLRIGPFERHWSTVVSSAVFIVLGLVFIVFRGGNALSSLYARVGAEDLAFRLEGVIKSNGRLIAIAFCLGPALTVLAFLRHRFSQRRRAIGGAHEPSVIATPEAAQVSGSPDGL